ncbi:LiaF transmembrane domain-containing protein [Mucilaginibacter antarcticus]|uniref:LiaF transmembrane domain-containing protein n=1 Tax=Mucilaginibacter antarcticus TaxID=1855725 RepID=UPI00362F4CDC
MTNDINNTDHPNKPGKGNVIAGIALLMIGVSFLLNQFDFGLPHWLFGWYTWIIAVGLYMGTRSNFRSLGWLVVTGLGFAFMLNDALPHISISRFYWPAALIGFGIYLILRRKNHTDYWDKNDWKLKWDAGKYNYRAPGVNEPVVDYTVNPDEPIKETTTPPATPGYNSAYGADDLLDAVSIFGGVKKIIFSKNFQGASL